MVFLTLFDSGYRYMEYVSLLGFKGCIAVKGCNSEFMRLVFTHLVIISTVLVIIKNIIVL